MNQLIKNIEQWAVERNLIEGSTKEKQFIKFIEELGELCSGISKNKIDVIKDSIGDCVVVLTILSKQLDFNIEYQIIKGYIGEFNKNVTVGRLIQRIVQSSYDLLGADLGVQCKFETFGRIIRSLKYICWHYEIDFKECIEQAYHEIKDRKGKMIDGVFVKKQDLQDNRNE